MTKEELKLSKKKLYHQTYNRERYHRRRALLTQEMGGECVGCGSTKKLEFDHIDGGSKSFDVSVKWTKPLQDLRDELKKCQLLCKPCHSEKSASARRRAVTHGTISGYFHYKCRCALCRESYSEYRKSRRRSGKEKKSKRA